MSESSAAAVADVPRPAVVPPQPYTFPEGRRRTLENGLEVVAYDVPGQYVHSVRVALPLPLARERRDIEGVATIMARSLDEGTERYSSSEFALLLERRGVALGTSISEAGLTVDVDVAKRHLGYALDLLRQVITEPAFPASEIDRHRIHLEKPIKEGGAHEVTIKLHADVVAKLIVNVKAKGAPDAPAEEPAEEKTEGFKAKPKAKHAK